MANPRVAQRLPVSASRGCLPTRARGNLIVDALERQNVYSVWMSIEDPRESTPSWAGNTVLWIDAPGGSPNPDEGPANQRAQSQPPIAYDIFIVFIVVGAARDGAG